MTMTVRNIDKKLFSELKSEAVRDGLTVGEALSIAIYEWLEKKKAKKKRLDFRDFKPTSWGKGTEKTSEEIDKILYGD